MMSLRTMLALWVLCSWWGLLACRRAANSGTEDERAVVKPRSGDVARLELEALTPRIDSGQIATVVVTLTNTAGHPLWVNRRLALNAALAPPQLREVWIRLKRPGGAVVSDGCIASVPPATASDYGVMDSGQNVRVEYNLKGLTRLAKEITSSPIEITVSP